METKINFVQNRTVFLSFTTAITTADINIPYDVDRIIFRSLADDGATDAYAVLTSDLISWNAIGVVFRNDAFANSTAQMNEYHFQVPTKIQGRYSFRLQNLDQTNCIIGGTESIVFIAEFIRGNGHGHA